MSIKDYEEYIQKSGNNFGYRYGFFKIMNDNFTIDTATYPGSYIDITPSFFFPTAYYIGTDKKAKKFFSNEEEIIEYIEKIKYMIKRLKLDFTQKIIEKNSMI